ncbi:T9SS type A sorting domain-containing protein [Flavobacterium oreochromis]|uniref:Secretion system C-terminal sorting domain-containing protein n=2 Tax=Flavobacterium TaxID=237 RepID=A0A246G8M5_9FLAO|nr:T9SS type A sorting domain-containing protein [Flavobacterium oreochromis]OWP74952.1 hypothetical protein BWG23_12360 [Flavobacterium oreochromis]OWP75322.1 hypothetical protein BWK62_12345 [Flavobacterium oreochromis]POR24140.1 hypothetical protein BWK58_08425 [Flavobacterium columnare]QYS87322.1 T9SS type A sorting domain-containing protein [Flavobacterium oreochromis]
MKKITLGLFSLLFYWNSQAAIVVRDINDFTFSLNTFVDLDFNNDNVPEFTMQYMNNSVESFFDPNMVNFVTTGTFDSGYGWDVMKFLSFDTTISSSSIFGAQADAYIDPSWANPVDFFPQGDSYIGCKFKLANSWHYGWILVNKNGNTITLKSYAYNDVAGQSIKAGQLDLLSNQGFQIVDNQFFPNPAKEIVTSKIGSSIKLVTLTDLTGKHFPVYFDNSSINLDHLQKGMYLLEVTYEQNIKSFTKIVKE